MGLKIPEDYMRINPTSIIPGLPPNAYVEDYKDDWQELVSRRLKKKFPWTTAPQRRVLANVSYRRMYRGEKDTIKVLGIDARGRPVITRFEYGAWHTWAVGQSGDATNPKDPIRDLTTQERSGKI